MVRRANVLENVRNFRNSGLQRPNPRNRNRNRNAQNPRSNNAPGNNQNRGQVRRVNRNRNFKGASGLAAKPGGNPAGGSPVNNRGKFKKNKKSFTFRRFNKSFKTKQNFKKNKQAKTADEMDMELDNYMGGEAAKARLDADLTKYFQDGTTDKQ